MATGRLAKTGGTCRRFASRTGRRSDGSFGLDVHVPAQQHVAVFLGGGDPALLTQGSQQMNQQMLANLIILHNQTGARKPLKPLRREGRVFPVNLW
jgi:hypothetical protein